MMSYQGLLEDPIESFVIKRSGSADDIYIDYKSGGPRDSCSVARIAGTKLNQRQLYKSKFRDEEDFSILDFVANSNPVTFLGLSVPLDELETSVQTEAPFLEMEVLDELKEPPKIFNENGNESKLPETDNQLEELMLEPTFPTLDNELVPSRSNVEILLPPNSLSSVLLQSRSNSDIRFWLHRISQYNDMLRNAETTLVHKLSVVGIKESGSVRRFAFLTDQILSKIKSTTVEIFKARDNFNKRLQTGWYAENNFVSVIEAWHWIIIEGVYRLDPPNWSKESCFTKVRLKIKLLSKEYRLLANAAMEICLKARIGLSVIKSMKHLIKKRFCKDHNNTTQVIIEETEVDKKMRALLDVRKSESQIPFELKEGDDVVKWGEQGLLLKKILGAEMHFGNLNMSERMMVFEIFIKEVDILIKDSKVCLEKACISTCFESHFGQKKTNMEKLFDDIHCILNTKKNLFASNIRTLIIKHVKDMSTELHILESAAEEVSRFFEAQSVETTKMYKQIKSIFKGTYLTKQRQAIITRHKEIYIKFSTPVDITFEPNPIVHSLTKQSTDNILLNNVTFKSSFKAFVKNAVFVQQPVKPMNSTENNNSRTRVEILLSKVIHSEIDAVKKEFPKFPDSKTDSFPPQVRAESSSCQDSVLTLLDNNSVYGDDIRLCSDEVKGFHFRCIAAQKLLRKMKKSFNSVSETLFAPIYDVQISGNSRFVEITAWLWIVARALQNLELHEEALGLGNSENNPPDLNSLKHEVIKRLSKFINIMPELYNIVNQVIDTFEKARVSFAQIKKELLAFQAPVPTPALRFTDLGTPQKKNVHFNDQDVQVVIKPDRMTINCMGKNLVYEQCRPEVRAKLIQIIFQRVEIEIETSCTTLKEAEECIENKLTSNTVPEADLITILYAMEGLLKKLHIERNELSCFEERVLMKSYEHVGKEMYSLVSILNYMRIKSEELIRELDLLKEPMRSFLQTETRGNKIGRNFGKEKESVQLECQKETFGFFKILIHDDEIMHKHMEDILMEVGLLPTMGQTLTSVVSGKPYSVHLKFHAQFDQKINLIKQYITSPLISMGQHLHLPNSAMNDHAVRASKINAVCDLIANSIAELYIRDFIDLAVTDKYRIQNLLATFIQEAKGLAKSSKRYLHGLNKEFNPTLAGIDAKLGKICNGTEDEQIGFWSTILKHSVLERTQNKLQPEIGKVRITLYWLDRGGDILISLNNHTIPTPFSYITLTKRVQVLCRVIETATHMIRSTDTCFTQWWKNIGVAKKTLLDLKAGVKIVLNKFKLKQEEEMFCLRKIYEIHQEMNAAVCCIENFQITSVRGKNLISLVNQFIKLKFSSEQLTVSKETGDISSLLSREQQQIMTKIKSVWFTPIKATIIISADYPEDELLDIEK